MAELENVRSIWLGNKNISIGTTKIEDNRYFFKRWGSILGNTPFGAHFRDIPFLEFDEYDLKRGNTGQKVRVYLCDLIGNRFYAMLPEQQIYALNHVNRENKALRQQIEQLSKLHKAANGDENWLKLMKRQSDVINQIRGGSGGSPYFGSHFPPSFPTTPMIEPQGEQQL